VSCSGCGTEVASDAVFCAKCGKQVSASGETKPNSIATFLIQVAAIVFGLLAAMLGCLELLEVVADAPNYRGGESWAGIDSFVSLPCVPFGLFALAIGLFVRKGPPRIRQFCIATGLANLALTFISFLLSELFYHH
jgi:hypothetical protein